MFVCPQCYSTIFTVGLISLEVIQTSCILYPCPAYCTSAVYKFFNTCPCPCSDHGPSCQRAGESCRRPRGPADGPLGQPPRAQGRPVPGQISDTLQTGGQHWMEGGPQTCRRAYTHFLCSYDTSEAAVETFDPSNDEHKSCPCCISGPSHVLPL